MQVVPGRSQSRNSHNQSIRSILSLIPQASVRLVPGLWLTLAACQDNTFSGCGPLRLSDRCVWLNVLAASLQLQ